MFKTFRKIRLIPLIFRSDCEHINDVVKPFDWTFTTDYKGTLIENANKKITVI